MRVLLVQPPRPYWPFTAEGDNFLLQQALPALAAMVRADGHEVKVIDCLPLRMGWKTLYEEVRSFKPELIGCGENHALYTKQAMRFFRLCREAAPEAITVAGGGHFSNLANRYATHADIDLICVGEGEITFQELVNEACNSDPDFSKIDGLVYGVEDKVHRNHPRALVKDLDSLPMPAYDMMPMSKYGRSRYLFSPGGATLHHSRGCVSSCSFCSWWTTMAERKDLDNGKQKLIPKWRTKSVDKMMEEVELLYYKYGKRSYVWVDESWNIDPRFNHDFSMAMINSGMKTKWMTFMRADSIVRDEKKGILEAQVRAGLSHILVGVERAEDETLTGLDKRFYTGGTAEAALKIFREKYPEVFVQATFIVGVEDEDQESLDRQLDMAMGLGVDFPAFHPITPVPGTIVFDEAIRDGKITMDEFDEFDWMTPVLDSKYMTRHEIAQELHRMNKKLVTPKWFLKGMTSKVDYKRDMYIWFAKVSAMMALDAVKHKINPLKVEHYQQLVTPKWYEQ